VILKGVHDHPLLYAHEGKQPHEAELDGFRELVETVRSCDYLCVANNQARQQVEAGRICREGDDTWVGFDGPCKGTCLPCGRPSLARLIWMAPRRATVPGIFTNSKIAMN
jgi:hypothetical protein